jgi:hypothetical protein
VTAESPAEAEIESRDWGEFLTATPPTSALRIPNLARYSSRGGSVVVATPDLLLHCPSDTCNGERLFSSPESTDYLETKKWLDVFLRYTCRNCRKSSKVYALGVFRDEEQLRGAAVKYGEWPPFGPPTPARVISLIGPDRDLFLRGRRAENQGLGIGAFAYYRRVVENQKNRMLDEVVRVARRLGSRPDVISALEAAKNETQFSRAMDSVKDAIPEFIRIDGHNPLTLLHRALSQGLHAKTEDECLALAQAIRLVLTELAERLGQALRDDVELREAVARLQGEARHTNGEGGSSTSSGAG